MLTLFHTSERRQETNLHVSVLFMMAREDYLLSMYDLYNCVVRNKVKDTHISEEGEICCSEGV